MGSTRPNPSHVGWVESGRVGLDLCDGPGCVEFFLIYYGGFGQKNSLNPIQPDPYTSLVFPVWDPHFFG